MEFILYRYQGRCALYYFMDEMGLMMDAKGVGNM